MGGVAGRVAAGLRRSIFIGQAGQQAGDETICPADAMSNAESGWRTGLGGIGTDIERVIG